MIKLHAQSLTWLNTTEDCPVDLCAHGTVYFAIDDLEFVVPGDGEWTLSASAIYLLRTLERDHTSIDQVGEHLFPCCGNGMYDVEESANVVIVGCCNGVDLSVVHRDCLVTITSAARESRSVTELQWANAVYHFSKSVRQFYDSSATKMPGDDHQRQGFEKMMKEWDRRLTRPAG